MSTWAGEPAEQLSRRAQGLGVNLTGPRRQILAAIASLSGPFSASELLKAVEAQAPEVGRATVFRTLQLLCEARLLERVSLPHGQEVYVVGHAPHHHHHLICTACGRIEELDGCGVEQLAVQLAQERGFLPQRHAFEVYGLCPACRRVEPR